MSAGTRRLVERRDNSPAGIARRAGFDASLKLLAELGLTRDAVEYYRRLARKKHVLPHELVREIAENAAASDAAILAKLGFDPGQPV